MSEAWVYLDVRLVDEGPIESEFVDEHRKKSWESVYLSGPWSSTAGVSLTVRLLKSKSSERLFRDTNRWSMERLKGIQIRSAYPFNSLQVSWGDIKCSMNEWVSSNLSNRVLSLSVCPHKGNSTVRSNTMYSLRWKRDRTIMNSNSPNSHVVASCGGTYAGEQYEFILGTTHWPFE